MVGHIPREVHIGIDAEEHRHARARTDRDIAHQDPFSLGLRIRHLNYGSLFGKVSLTLRSPRSTECSTMFEGQMKPVISRASVIHRGSERLKV